MTFVLLPRGIINCLCQSSVLYTTELSKFVEDTQRGSRPHFREVKLSGKHFNDSRPNYIEAISKCIQGRFNDLEKDFFKAVHLLDTNLWPTTKDDLSTFGVAYVSVAVDHFQPLEWRVAGWGHGRLEFLQVVLG